MAPSTKLALALAALSAASQVSASGDDCYEYELSFVLLDGDATQAALADDIVSDLAEVGITAVTRYGGIALRRARVGGAGGRVQHVGVRGFVPTARW